MENLIEVKGLSKSYPSFDLQSLSFTMPAGSIMGLIGQNGSGKTTTIKLLLNLIRRGQGTIKILGLDSVQEEMKIKDQIGIVLDEPPFPGRLTLKQIAYIVSGHYSRWNQREFSSCVERFALPLDKKFEALSTGTKAKFSLAIALSHGAKLLILDEPTAGLDPIVREEILSMLFEVVEQEDQGVLFSSHITSDLEKVADYITFIHDGRLVFQSTKDALMEQYRIVKGPRKDLPRLKGKIYSYREVPFGFEALTTDAEAIRKLNHQAFHIERATIDDIMLYHIKGELL